MASEITIGDICFVTNIKK